MATKRHTKVEPVSTSRGMGKADTTAATTLFASSPIHSGDISDDSIEATFNSLVLQGTVEGGYMLAGAFDRDYSDAPNIADVEAGAGGLPASGHVPNPSSPGEGSVKAGDLPAAPEGYGVSHNDQFGTGVGSDLEPANSSAAQATHEVGDYTLGKSVGS